MNKREFLPIDLTQKFNNDGISYDDDKSDGAFDESGATYPGEELPESNSLIHISGVPFFFPSKEEKQWNNFVLMEQYFPITPGLYNNLFVLGASDGKKGEYYREKLTIGFGDGSRKSIDIGLSNWLLAPVFNEKLAFICSHLHFPDIGQISARNRLAKSVARETLYTTSDVHYTARDYLEGEGSPITKGSDDWKPKIWLQEAEIPAEKVVTELAFENENLNFHVFCMTLERSRPYVES